MSLMEVIAGRAAPRRTHAGHNLAARRAAVAFSPVTRASPLQTVGDDQLVLLLRGRDEAAERALDELYCRYSGAVFGMARRMVRDERVAEELLQETFWRVWRHAGRYEPGRVRFATWLLRIAHNLAASELRRESHRPRTNSPRDEHTTDDDPHGLPEMVDTAPDIPDQVWQAEQRRALAAGLVELPAAQRQAVELAYFGGLTHVQIAARQGAPVSTVKTRLALGLRKLAAHLRGREMAPEPLGATEGPGTPAWAPNPGAPRVN